MSDELRAAAELIRSKDSIANRYDNAAWNLANAYLAEHPADDGEPVTEAWCVSAGLIHGLPRVSYPRVVSKFGVAVDVTFGKGNVCLWVEDVEAKVGNVTRGDVRRLASALGIELKASVNNAP